MFTAKILVAIVETISSGTVAIYLNICRMHTVENMGRGKTETKISAVGVETIRRDTFIDPSGIQKREARFEMFPQRMVGDHPGQLSSIKKSLVHDFNRSETKEGTEFLGIKIIVKDTMPRLHSQSLNIIIQVVLEQIRKGFLLVSQWACRTKKGLTEINVSRQQRVTCNGMLYNKISKTLFIGVAEFSWCTGSVATGKSSKR